MDRTAPDESMTATGRQTRYGIRHAIGSAAAARMGTAELREALHIGGLFQPGLINLTYTHYDRMIVGGAMPVTGELPLEAIPPAGTPGFLDRRELIAVNIGGAGIVAVGAERFAAGHRDMVYAGRGSGVTFASTDPLHPAKFYLLSAPAHQAHPSCLITRKDARRIDLGSRAGSNERSIYQYVHGEGPKTCQLVAGMTELAEGSVWNTMPCHVHDRRMEVYLYFGLAPSARVFHFAGEPSETRHLVLANEEAALSPPWSIHSGCGTSNYTFIWAMAGDNVDYTDVDPVTMDMLK